MFCRILTKTNHARISHKTSISDKIELFCGCRALMLQQQKTKFMQAAPIYSRPVIIILYAPADGDAEPLAPGAVGAYRAAVSRFGGEIGAMKARVG